MLKLINDLESPLGLEMIYSTTDSDGNPATLGEVAAGILRGNFEKIEAVIHKKADKTEVATKYQLKKATDFTTDFDLVVAGKEGNNTSAIWCNDYKVIEVKGIRAKVRQGTLNIYKVDVVTGVYSLIKSETNSTAENATIKDILFDSVIKLKEHERIGINGSFYWMQTGGLPHMYSGTLGSPLTLKPDGTMAFDLIAEMNKVDQANSTAIGTNEKLNDKLSVIRTKMNYDTFTGAANATVTWCNDLPYKGLVKGIRVRRISSSSTSIIVRKLNIKTGAWTDIKTFTSTQLGELDVLFDSPVNISQDERIGVKGALPFLSGTGTYGVYRILSDSTTVVNYLTDIQIAYYLLIEDSIKALQETYSSIIQTISPLIVKKTTITVPNSNPFSIRNTIANITDASNTNRFKVRIPSGTYTEIDIVMKNFVDLEGQNPDDTIINIDKSSSVITPSDARNRMTGADMGNKALNTIPFDVNNWDVLHILWYYANTEANVKNMQFVTNLFKYCVHIDNPPGNIIAEFNNCIFKSTDGVANVGIGLHAGDDLKFISCLFEHSTNLAPNREYSINLHNSASQSGGTSFVAQGCRFNNGIVRTGELASGQADICRFINCATSSTSKSFYISADEASSPYSMRTFIENCKYNSNTLVLNNRTDKAVVII